MKTGRAGKGAAHARYVQGEGRYSERDDVAFIEHGNMPEFAQADPLAFWHAADANERANGRAYREVEFAIPRELQTEKEQIKFAQRFTDKLIGMGHAYTLAIHDKQAGDGGRNVHAHLMFTERKNDGIERDAVQFFKRANPKQPHKGGAAKDRALNSRQFVTSTRALYESAVNRELEARDVAPISMARNEQLEPEPKLGPQHPRAGQDPRREVRAKIIQDLRSARSEWKAILKEHISVRSEILDLESDLKTALAERDAMRIKAAEQLARFRAGVAQAPRPEGNNSAVEARRKAKALAERSHQSASPPIAPTSDTLNAHSHASVLQELSKQGYEVSLVDTERGLYSGVVLLVTDFHVAQDLGRHQAAVHDRDLLTGEVKAGESVRIRYDSGRGSAVPSRSTPRRKGHGL